MQPTIDHLSTKPSPIHPRIYSSPLRCLLSLPTAIYKTHIYTTKGHHQQQHKHFQHTHSFYHITFSSQEAASMADTRTTNRTYEDFDATVEWSSAAEADAVKISLPGFKREQIRVMVDNQGNLRTHGERPVAGNRWSRFRKDFKLPATCDVDGIRAKFENETLTITLPNKTPSPQAPTVPALAPPQPEPRRPATAPPQKPPQALPELPKPSPLPRTPATTPVPSTAPPQKPPPSPSPVPPTLPPAPSQKPEGRPSLPRKPPAPEPAPPTPGPELVPRNRYNGDAATTKPETTAVLKPKEEEDRKMMEEKKKKASEEERMMDMAQQRRSISARRRLLMNVAVAVVVLVGITVYVWHNLRNATAGGDHGHGEPGAGSYSDEM